MTDIAIFEDVSGTVEVRLEQESVWLTQKQIADVLETTPENVNMHLRNVFADKELESDSTTKKILVVRQEGKRQVRRQVLHYNLDAILAVGYRVSSGKASRFRQWATRILREHLTQGYTINRDRFETNARELEAALELVRNTARTPALTTDAGRALVDVVTRYANTFLLLQRYDEGLLTEPPATRGGTLPTFDEARRSLDELKRALIARGEATELFAQERGDGLAALLGNLDQTVLGEPAYPSVESKAVHLLYFVVKNHPFADGNKRSAAYLMVDFLSRNNRLMDAKGEPVINDNGLAALTLLVAESQPAQKDTMIHLIMNMLAQPEAGGTR